MRVFPTDVSRHVMYSLPNPSESERPFSPLEEPVLPALGRRGGEGRGTEQNRFLCCVPGTPCYWPRRSQDPKGPISLALGSWRWGGGYGGGEGWGLGMKGRGWRIFEMSL